MKVLGIPLQPVGARETLLVGVVVLFMLLLIVPLRGVVEPQTILGWTFASATGAFLSAMGVNVSRGWRHAAVVVPVSALAGFVGHVIGVAVLSWMA